jgi:UDP-MurNAc hydroxylase
MFLEWVNHAGFVLGTGALRLLCDPWLEGTAFNNGWRLLSPTVFGDEDFATITHIWFSHEHPDHFSPPSLKRIPEKYRRRITVLFRDTKDKRVLNACKQWGFQTIELPIGPAVNIGGAQLTCGRAGRLDSWLILSAEGKTILNINDCAFHKLDAALKEIKKKAGEIDLLLSQFSYANWVGNPGDRASHRLHAERKLQEMRRQIEIFRPAQFVPFASYIYFSHAENFFMNQEANRISGVYAHVTNELRTPAIVLYPGEKWEVGTPKDSAEAISKYEADFDAALLRSPDTSPVVALDTLQKAAASMIERASKRNNSLLLRTIAPTVVHLSDLNADIELSYRRGLVPASNRQPDIITSSDSILYCITTNWGGDTLAINGRYQVPPGANPMRFFRCFRVLAYNDAGNSFTFTFLGTQAVRKIRAAVAGREVPSP